jgi:hypothetical protein
VCVFVRFLLSLFAETYKSLAFEMDKNNTLSTLEILGMYAETKAD